MQYSIVKGLVFFFALIVFTPCRAFENVRQTSPVDHMPQYGKWGFDISGSDKAIAPGDDFFGYANGLWLNHTTIPADKPQNTLRLMMTDTIEQRVHEMLEEMAKDVEHDLSTLEGKLGAFYKAFMNEVHIENLGASPISPWLENIRNLQSAEGLAALMGHSADDFTASIFSINIYEDQ